MTTSPTCCNKHLHLLFFAHGIGPPNPPLSEQRWLRLHSVHLRWAGGTLMCAFFLGLAAQTYSTDSLPPPNRPASDIFPLSFIASGWRFSFSRETPPHYSSPLWRAANPIYLPNFLHWAPSVVRGLWSCRKKKDTLLAAVGNGRKEGASRL